MYGATENSDYKDDAPITRSLLSGGIPKDYSRMRGSERMSNVDGIVTTPRLPVAASGFRRGSVLTRILNKSSYSTLQLDSDMEPGADRGLGMQPSNDVEGRIPVGAVRQKPKSFIYTLLNPRSYSWQAVMFKWFITFIIVSDLICFVISTEPQLSDHYRRFFQTWEGVTSTIFLIEYITRVLVVTEAVKYGEKGWFWGRLSYIFTPSALIDFAATLPFFLELSTGWDLPTLTYIRSFRLLRILKTSGYTEATNAVYRVIYYNRQILYVALLICIGLVLITAVLMYYLRPQGEEYSKDFESLAATMYLSTLMLTGQGGPDGDLPWYTKSVVLMTGVFSIGMFAIPASMLTWGFEAEAERIAKMSYSHKRKQTTGPDQDNWSYSSADYSTDEEYRRIITGGEDSDDDESRAEKLFSLADVDGSGNISLSEFLALSRQQAEATQKARSESVHVSNPDLIMRVRALEREVAENTTKLDKIIVLLENIKK